MGGGIDYELGGKGPYYEAEAGWQVHELNAR